MMGPHVDITGLHVGGQKGPWRESTNTKLADPARSPVTEDSDTCPQAQALDSNTQHRLRACACAHDRRRARVHSRRAGM